MQRKFKNISKLIKEKRRLAMMSQRDLSARLGYENNGYQFISNIEREKCGLPAKKINDMANALKITTDEIIEAMAQDELEYIYSSVEESINEEKETECDSLTEQNTNN